MWILAVTDLRQWPTERENMPLLRSLADRAVHVAINMAHLTELFTSLEPPLHYVKPACKRQVRGRDQALVGEPAQPADAVESSVAADNWLAIIPAEAGDTAAGRIANHLRGDRRARPARPLNPPRFTNPQILLGVLGR